jgi:hypothetical protein
LQLGYRGNIDPNQHTSKINAPQENKKQNKFDPCTLYLYIYIPRPAGGYKFLPAGQASEIIGASEIFAVSAKNWRFVCLGESLAGQLPFFGSVGNHQDDTQKMSWL